MKTILVFDTETTGMIDWKNPSGGETQPHIVQLAAVLCNIDTAEVIESMDVIVAPDGWSIPQEVVDIHGISEERAHEVGIPEVTALEMFIDLWQASDYLAAHNRTFDQRIVRIAMKRYKEQQVIDDWAEKDNFDCTMLQAKPIMEMLPKNRFGFKSPKLEEAYKFFTGKEIENAHNAMADTLACKDVWFAIRGGRTTQCPTI